jgi:hypothetical protein
MPIGNGVPGLVCVLNFTSMQGWSALGPSVITLCVILAGSGLGRYLSRLVPHCPVGVASPRAVFAQQMLTESGRRPCARRLLCDRLATRGMADGPGRLPALPGQGPAALHLDATPALNLLAHPRPEVASLPAALGSPGRRGQMNWCSPLPAGGRPEVRQPSPPGQRRGSHPGRVLAEFLRVRRGTFARRRRRRPDRTAAGGGTDSPRGCRCSATRLKPTALRARGPVDPEAVGDLTAWAAEKGILGSRSA